MAKDSQLGLQLKGYEKQIDARTPRERVLLFLSVAAVIVMLWFTAIHEPLQSSGQTIEKSLKQKQQSIAFSKEEMGVLEQMPKDERLLQAEEKIEELSNRLARIEQDIATNSKTFVQPKEMAAMMRRLLATANVTLIQMNRIQPPAIQPDSEEAEVTERPNFFEFPLEMEIEGEFFEIADFLAQIEQLPWRIFWDSLTYEVQVFPKARVKLRVHTLGSEEHWLGV